MAVADFSRMQPKPAWQLAFQGAWPTSVAFLGPQRLAAGNRDGEVYLWQLPDQLPEPVGQEDENKSTVDRHGPWPVRQLIGHTNGITHLVALADGKTLVSASLDHSIRLWDVEAASSGTAEAVLDIHARREAAKREKSDDPLEAPGISLETIDSTTILQRHSDWVTALGAAADATRLISGDDRASVVIWPLPAGEPVVQWRGTAPNGVSTACLTPDGKKAFVAEFRSRRGDFDRPPAQAKIYNADDGTQLVDLLEVQFPDVKQRDNSYGYHSKWSKFVGRGFVASAFSPDGRHLAVGQGGEIGKAQVHLIDVDNGELVRSVSEHQYGVTDVRFSADGEYLLTSGRDTTIRICRVEDGKQFHQLGKPRGGQFKDWIHSFDISPDQRLLAAADISGQIQVWLLSENAA